jgi:hypothetical protein
MLKYNIGGYGNDACWALEYRKVGMTKSHLIKNIVIYFLLL